jgi:hypothetical protein
MRNEPIAARQRGNATIILLGLLLLVGLLAGWHLRLVSAVNERVRSLQDAGNRLGGQLEISVNAPTNLVSVTVFTGAGATEDDALEGLGSALRQAVVQTLGPSIIERELNTRAREQYDFYAMLIPYRVRIVTKTASR